jgi:hypothetical protein
MLRRESTPAVKFMEDYARNCVDTRSFDTPYSDWHSDDYSLLKLDGTEIKGGKDAWAGVGATYAPFTGHHHQPIFVSCIKTAYGYEMIGQAWVFANFPGASSAGEQKQKDNQGKEWDMKARGSQDLDDQCKSDWPLIRSQAASVSST